MDDKSIIKVLQIGLGSNPGGMENCILNYYKYIDHTKFQFDFIDMYGKGLAYSDEIEKLGGYIHLLGSYKKTPVKVAKRLKNVLKNNKYDIVHINMLSAANLIPVFISCKYSNAKVIVHSHNSAIPSGTMRRVMNFININILRQFPVEKWACGIQAGKWMWKESFKDKNVIFNAIDNKKFIKNYEIRNQIKNKCNFELDDKIIGFVGRLSEQKNPLFLIDIFNAIKKKHINTKLLIVGDGELRSELERKIELYGLKEDVYFAGVQENIVDWYQVMDIFVLPSFFEGLPVVGIEAQANGLLCFFSDRITKEVEITKNVYYLPIDKGVSIWSNTINDEINRLEKRKVDFPVEYKIEYAAKRLEKKYEEVVNKRNNHDK